MYNLWEIAFQISGRLEKKTGDSDSHHVTRWQWWSKIYVWVYVSVLMCDKRSRIRCQQTQQPGLMNNMSNETRWWKERISSSFFHLLLTKKKKWERKWKIVNLRFCRRISESEKKIVIKLQWSMTYNIRITSTYYIQSS